MTREPSDVHFVIPTLALNEPRLRVAVDSVLANGIRPVLVVPPGTAISPAVRDHVDVLFSPRRGLSHALNVGLGAAPAQARYFSWIGDDDALAPHAIAVTRSSLVANPSAPFVFGWCRVVRDDDTLLKLARPGRLAPLWMRYGTDFVPQPGSLIRLEALEQIGRFDESLRYSVDLEMFLALMRLGQPAYVSRELATWRVQPASLSSTKPDGGAEAWRVRQRYWSATVRRTSRLWRLPAAIVDLGFRAASRYITGQYGTSRPDAYWVAHGPQTEA